MLKVTIEYPSSARDRGELDELLWRVLWQPLELPRNVRDQFKLEGDSFELVANHNGRVIGGAAAVWGAGDEVEIRHLAVDPEATSQGVGSQLVEKIATIVRAKGCRNLHTIARNTSVDFFKSLGFRKRPGVTPEYPLFTKHGITFELMEKAVEQHAP